MDYSPPGSSVHGTSKNTSAGSHFLLHGIFLTRGLNPGLLHWQADSLPLSHLGSWRVLTTDTLSLLWLLLLPETSSFFLYSFVPLQLVTTEACSRASTALKLRSQNGLRQKWPLFCQEIHSRFSFSRDSLPY